MPARPIGVCLACQDNNHNACAEMGCVCSFRRHPDRKPIRVQVNRYEPSPE